MRESVNYQRILVVDPQFPATYFFQEIADFGLKFIWYPFFSTVSLVVKNIVGIKDHKKYLSICALFMIFKRFKLTNNYRGMNCFFLFYETNIS